MYRTERWLQNLKDNKLETPICVPSYKRPNAPLFTSKIAQSLDKDHLFVCIRNDEQEINSYKWLEEQNIASIVLLNDVTDIGNTRGAIVSEFYKRDYKNIFMLDDTVVNITVNQPHITKTNKTYMGSAPWSDPYKAFLIWEYLHNNYKAEGETYEGAVLSSPANYKGFDFDSSLIDKPNFINAGLRGNFICLDIKTIIENDLNYKAISEVGSEDVYSPYKVMKAGFPVRAFTDLSGEMINTQKSSLSGGDNSVYNGNRADRLDAMRKIFVEKTLQRIWGEPIKDLGLKYRKTKFEGTSLSFDWKYWQQYYKDYHTKE